jgi:hypothetical protein
MQNFKKSPFWTKQDQELLELRNQKNVKVKQGCATFEGTLSHCTGTWSMSLHDSTKQFNASITFGSQMVERIDRIATPNGANIVIHLYS